MARHDRSLAFVITFTTATWLIGTIGCQAHLAQAGGAPVPALISDAPVDSGDRTPSDATSGRVVAAPGRITDFAPAERSVTVDAGTVNLRRIFEDLGLDATLWYQHVQTLANPFFEGRAPETHGQTLTAEYVEFFFRKYDLEPAFSSSYTQPFSYHRRGATRVTIQVAELSVNGRRLTEGIDFVVLGNSGDGELTAPITFVGYAIEEGPGGYSSFDDDTDLAGRAALLLRHTPVDESGESLWDEQQARWQGSLRRKMRAVAERGAAAIIMVNPPGADSPSALEQPNGRFGPGLEIPVVQVSAEIVDAMLVENEPDGRDLAAWRRMADAGRTTTNDFDDIQVTFNTAVKRTRNRRELGGTNVAGILRGRGDLADKYVVIGAHHDHVGVGNHGGTRPANRGRLHPGADDNASGTAGVLVLARMLDESYRNAPRNMDLRSIIFVTFDAEEMGLHGSRAFAEDLPVDMETISIMLNMDMIGRLRSHNISVLGIGTGEGLADLLRPHFERSGLTVSVTTAGSGRSDDANFHAINVPALHFFTGMHDEYTTPGDMAYTVNPAGATEILDLLFDIAYDVASRPRKLVYRDPGPGRGENRGYGRVRLGIRPSMDDNIETGVAVAAVSTGTSAEAGGIHAGDVIVSWDDKKIADMQDLFERLQRHEPGDKVKITVLRGSEKVVLDITLKAS